MEQNITRVGVGVMIFRNGKILLGKRKNSHGSGEFAFPGGHLDYLEGFEDCAKREVAEETGLTIKNVRFQMVSNIKQYAPKHYVHIGLIADCEEGEAKVLEPEKCEGWNWYNLEDLPEPLFAVCKLSIEAYKSGCSYIDASEHN